MEEREATAAVAASEEMVALPMTTAEPEVTAASAVLQKGAMEAKVVTEILLLVITQYLMVVTVASVVTAALVDLEVQLTATGVTVVLEVPEVQLMGVPVEKDVMQRLPYLPMLCQLEVPVALGVTGVTVITVAQQMGD